MSILEIKALAEQGMLYTQNNPRGDRQTYLYFEEISTLCQQKDGTMREQDIRRWYENEWPKKDIELGKILMKFRDKKEYKDDSLADAIIQIYRLFEEKK